MPSVKGSEILDFLKLTIIKMKTKILEEKFMFVVLIFIIHILN